MYVSREYLSEDACLQPSAVQKFLMRARITTIYEVYLVLTGLYCRKIGKMGAPQKTMTQLAIMPISWSDWISRALEYRCMVQARLYALWLIILYLQSSLGHYLELMSGRLISLVVSSWLVPSWLVPSWLVLYIPSLYLLIMFEWQRALLSILVSFTLVILVGTIENKIFNRATWHWYLVFVIVMEVLMVMTENAPALGVMIAAAMLPSDYRTDLVTIYSYLYLVFTIEYIVGRLQWMRSIVLLLCCIAGLTVGRASLERYCPYWRHNSVANIVVLHCLALFRLCMIGQVSNLSMLIILSMRLYAVRDHRRSGDRWALSGISVATLTATVAGYITGLWYLLNSSIFVVFGLIIYWNVCIWCERGFQNYV
jgi:hypothetical protein